MLWLLITRFLTLFFQILRFFLFKVEVILKILEVNFGILVEVICQLQNHRAALFVPSMIKTSKCHNSCSVWLQWDLTVQCSRNKQAIQKKSQEESDTENSLRWKTVNGGTSSKITHQTNKCNNYHIMERSVSLYSGFYPRPKTGQKSENCLP